MTALKIIAVIVCAYLLGTVNAAYFISKAKKIDMRGEGTGNYGTSNSFVLMGAKIGVLVAVCDIAKAVVATLIPRLIFPELSYIAYVGGAACVIGHIFPFYIGFRGGKGFASYLGMAVVLDWRMGLVLCAVVVVAILASNYMVVGTMLTVISTPIWALFYSGEWIGAIIIAAVSVIIILKHIENFVNICRGTEFKVRAVVFKKKK